MRPWDNLPEEMRWQAQWLVAGPDDNGELKAPYRAHNGKLIRASKTNPDHWMDYESACEWAEAYGTNIGFVLSDEDPYTCIDLDVKNANNAPNDPDIWTSQEQLERYWSIVQVFDSFTERSRSGQGLHIWVRGKIGAGLKRDGVELYSQERFIVCTGNVIVNKQIENRQEYLNNMASQMRAAGAGEQIELVEIEEEFTDAEILDRAINAGNADKFNALCSMTAGPEGSWRNQYPSQSEADLALMSIFTFYSKSNAQCKRLFRMCPLSHREKAMKDDVYLNRTLRLIRTRQDREQKISDSAAAMAASLVQELQTKALTTGAAPAMEAVAGEAPVPDTGDGIAWPPGCVGALAQFIYSTSPRPVKEVSIVAALGFAAGLLGKAYHIPNSGLNLYIILIARSAIGKEAMHSGIASICSQIQHGGAGVVYNYVSFNEFASGPALQKAIAANSCFVNIESEFGKKLERLAREDGRDAAMQTLRAAMTKLYQKSGPQSVAGGLTYSNKEENVQANGSVAFSMIGETTPDTFYESLTENMMKDGFLSRFTTIEYDGPRPPLNQNQIKTMAPDLLHYMVGLVNFVTRTLDSHQTVQVTFTEEAMEILWSFNLKCDEEINKTKDESWRQMWNRAHLKALRISALLAAADNCGSPVVMHNHAEWALDLVRRDISMFTARLNSGDIGSGDNVREVKMIALMREFLSTPPAAGYGIPDAMHKAGIVPRKWLQMRCSRLAMFTSHRNGATGAIDLTLRSMADSGYIIECEKSKIVGDYNFHGKCYRVLSLS